jgi:heme oxygenase
MTSLDDIKAATWPLHREAERSGIVAAILAGTATREGVALLWRNLLPVYQALDATSFGLPALVRSDAIEADLAILAPDADLPLLPEAAEYAARVRSADAGRLIAHAYVRYLGDLNGGLLLQRKLTASLGVAPLAFHAFPGIADPRAFAAAYRAGLDQALAAADGEAVLAEAVAAFTLNIALSRAVAAALPRR